MLRQRRIVDQDPRAGLQRGNQRLQDPHAVRVAPVVEDEAEEIHICARHGVRRQEVMALEGDAILDVRWDLLGCRGDRARQVLTYELQVRMYLRDRNGHEADSAADVDDYAVLGQVLPGVVRC